MLTQWESVGTPGPHSSSQAAAGRQGGTSHLPWASRTDFPWGGGYGSHSSTEQKWSEEHFRISLCAEYLTTLIRDIALL